MSSDVQRGPCWRDTRVPRPHSGSSSGEGGSDDCPSSEGGPFWLGDSGRCSPAGPLVPRLPSLVFSPRPAEGAAVRFCCPPVQSAAEAGEPGRAWAGPQCRAETSEFKLRVTHQDKDEGPGHLASRMGQELDWGLSGLGPCLPRAPEAGAVSVPRGHPATSEQVETLGSQRTEVRDLHSVESFTQKPHRTLAPLTPLLMKARRWEMHTPARTCLQGHTCTHLRAHTCVYMCTRPHVHIFTRNSACIHVICVHTHTRQEAKASFQLGVTPPPTPTPRQLAYFEPPRRGGAWRPGSQRRCQGLRAGGEEGPATAEARAGGCAAGRMGRGHLQ